VPSLPSVPPSLHRVSSSLLGPVDPAFRAFYGRLKFTVRRHKVNKDSLSCAQTEREVWGVEHWKIPNGEPE